MENIQIRNHRVKINTAESGRAGALNVGVRSVFQVSTDWSFPGSVFLLELCLRVGFWQGWSVCIWQINLIKKRSGVHCGRVGGMEKTPICKKLYHQREDILPTEKNMCSEELGGSPKTKHLRSVFLVLACPPTRQETTVSWASREPNEEGPTSAIPLWWEIDSIFRLPKRKRVGPSLPKASIYWPSVSGNASWSQITLKKAKPHVPFLAFKMFP